MAREVIDGYSPTNPIGVPTPEEQAELLVSPEARLARQMGRLGAMPVLFSVYGIRGRRRTELEGGGDESALTDARIVQLGRFLSSMHPMFDKFSRHGHINPADTDSIDVYVMGGNKHNMQTGTTVRGRAMARDARERQSQHIGDALVRTLFEDFTTARLRRQGLRTTRSLIETGQTLHPVAATLASDAVRDLGYTLYDQEKKPRMVTAFDIPRQLVSLANRAMDDPDALREHPIVLKLAQLEQAARVDFWRPRFEAVNAHMPGRLTPDHLQSQDELEELLLEMDQAA